MKKTHHIEGESMKLKVAFIVQAIVALPFGIGFVAVPELLMGPYINGTLTTEYLFLTRLYGSKALGLGLLALLGIWFTELRAKRGLAYGLGLFTLSHCALFIIGSAQGILTSLGWMQAAITGIITILYAIGLLSEKS
jgi:hypothetical protein